ncbi:hypothetical protein DFAR_450007 [Desulfarculales bacterium]
MSMRVVCLLPEGALAQPMRPAGAQVTCLGLAPGLAVWPTQLVQTWMYYADLLGLLAARPLKLSVVWSLSCSDLDLSRYRHSTRLVLKASVTLTRLKEP